MSHYQKDLARLDRDAAVLRAMGVSQSAAPLLTRGYRTKREAAQAFLSYGPNEEIAESWGGADQVASKGEFDSLNEMRGFKGQRRVTTLQRAVETAIPGTKAPYRLDDIRLDLLNETAPARDMRRRFVLPVADVVAEREWDADLAERVDAEFSDPRHHGRPGARKKRATVPRVKHGRAPVLPAGPGYPLSGYQCEDPAGRLVRCDSPMAATEPVRVKYRPKLPDGSRPVISLRPRDKPVVEAAQDRRERTKLRRAAGAEDAADRLARMLKDVPF